MNGGDSDNENGPALACFRDAGGRWVVEADLRRGGAADLAHVVDAARRAGAGAVWVHANAIDAGLGFRQRGGYARLEAEQLPPPAELAQPPGGQVRALQAACYAGVWGHSEPADEPDPESLYFGLHEFGSWVGICAVDLGERWIDGPGLLPSHRTADRYARLVGAAASALEPGSVTLESWGDSRETLAAYRELGFVLAEYVPGWELLL